VLLLNKIAMTRATTTYSATAEKSPRISEPERASTLMYRRTERGMASKKRIPGIFCFMKRKIVKKPHNAALKLN